MKKRLIWGGVFLCICTLILYFSFLYIARLGSYGLQTYLESKGVIVHSLSLERPGINSLHLKELSGIMETEEILSSFEIRGLTIPYSLLQIVSGLGSVQELKHKSGGLHADLLAATFQTKEKSESSEIEEKTKKKIFQTISEIEKHIHFFFNSHSLKINDLKITYGDFLTTRGTFGIFPEQNTEPESQEEVSQKQQKKKLKLLLPEIQSSRNAFHGGKGFIEADLENALLKKIVISLDSPFVRTDAFEIGLHKIELAMQEEKGKLNISLTPFIHNQKTKKKESIHANLLFGEEDMKYTATLQTKGFELSLSQSPLSPETEGIYFKNNTLSLPAIYTTGTISLSGKIPGTPLIKKGALVLESKEPVSMNIEPFSLSSLKAELEIQKSSASGVLIQTKLFASKLEGPIQGENLEGNMDIQLKNDFTPREIRLTNARLGVFGGYITARSDRIFPFEKETDVFLEGHDIEIEDVLSLYPNSVQGSGKIHASLPLHISKEGVHMENGIIQGKDGGILRYTGGGLSAGGNQNLQIVAKALENYHYTNLEARADYSLEGDLFLSLQLQGRNPDYMNERPIHFNLNLEENIPALIKSLTIGKNIVGQINEQYQKK